MTASALKTIGLTKRFGGFLATDDVHLELFKGEIHAIIGPNGAGKTSLIRQLSGEVRSDSGTVYLGGKNISRSSVSERSLAGIGRSFQVSSIVPSLTVVENAMLARLARSKRRFDAWRSFARDAEMRASAEVALKTVGLVGKSELLAGELAHGERRQLELAIVIASEPSVLLLDEPLAGMGAGESKSIIELISSWRVRYSILLIEHDMNAVFALADRITVLVYGRVLTTGTPEQIKQNESVRTAYLGNTA
jgi:branched-chain amino acid transport system ATP-binding protein